MKFLGVKVHGGYTSEARVFAALLGARQDAYAARVLYHHYPGSGDGAPAFSSDSKAEILCSDMALRPSGQSAAQKIASLLKFRASFSARLKEAYAFGPDVIYSSQQLWDCALAAFLARRLKKPHIIHLHYVIGPWLRTGFSSSPSMTLNACRITGIPDPLNLLKKCAHVVAISDYIRTQAIDHGVLPQRVTTVTNTVPVFPKNPSERNTVRHDLGVLKHHVLIGIVGRFDLDKGHIDTFRAFQKIAMQYPETQLILVGEGPLKMALEQEVIENNLSGRVTLTGQRSDVPRLLQGMDIFCHPSRREPFGLALAEASAAALPVVAYAEGGACEIIRHNETGLLAQPGSIDSLVECLRRLLDDPQAAVRMGTVGRKRITSQFCPEKAGHDFTALLSGVCSKKNRV